MKVRGVLRARCFTQRMDDDQLKEKCLVGRFELKFSPISSANVWQIDSGSRNQSKLSFFGAGTISWLRPARSRLAPLFWEVWQVTGSDSESSQANSRKLENLGSEYVQSVEYTSQLRTY